MKIIIELNDNNLASIQFFEGEEEITFWIDLTHEKRVEFLNTLRSMTSLFSKCI